LKNGKRAQRTVDLLEKAQKEDKGHRLDCGNWNREKSQGPGHAIVKGGHNANSSKKSHLGK